MNAHNRRIVLRLIGDIDSFTVGGLELDDIHSRVQTTFTLLERDDSTARETIRLAEADVEEIRHTMLLDEQRPAAVFRLEQLRDALATELGT